MLYEGWRGTGALNTAAWLAWRIDIGAVAAREHVRVARALGGLPRIDSAFAAGELSYAKVRALTRVATVEDELEFIQVAMHTAVHEGTLSVGVREGKIVFENAYGMKLWPAPARDAIMEIT